MYEYYKRQKKPSPLTGTGNEGTKKIPKRHNREGEKRGGSQSAVDRDSCFRKRKGGMAFDTDSDPDFRFFFFRCSPSESGSVSNVFLFANRQVETA